jgi:hypothetical protein
MASQEMAYLAVPRHLGVVWGEGTLRCANALAGGGV